MSLVKGQKINRVGYKSEYEELQRKIELLKVFVSGMGTPNDTLNVTQFSLGIESTCKIILDELNSRFPSK